MCERKPMNMYQKYEWDDRKNSLKQKKHGISFELATGVFEDPMCLDFYDAEHSSIEDRYIAIGKINDVLFVVYTERKDKIRIISARRATAKERRLYYDSNL